MLNDKFGIQKGLLTTVHAYTNSQKLQDVGAKDPRDARAAAQNIVPSETGAAKAVGLVIPELQGRFGGMAFRVPTPTVSVIDFTAILEREVTKDEIRAAMLEYAAGPMKGLLDVTDEPLVSTDLKGTTYSSVFSAMDTIVLGNLVKVVAWYDNEWGYACRVARPGDGHRQESVSSKDEQEDDSRYPAAAQAPACAGDLNVPLKDGPDGQRAVADDTRIRAALPTIQYLLERNGRGRLVSHLGRPKGGPEPKYSLKPAADRLAELLGKPVPLAADCVGPQAEHAAAAMMPGQVILLENVRFHPEEEKNDPVFAQRLSVLADIYVNDAFGSAHRAHASTEGVAHYLPGVAGLLMEKELEYLGAAIENPAHPYVAILGGAKISDKIGVIDNLLARRTDLSSAAAWPTPFSRRRAWQWPSCWWSTPVWKPRSLSCKGRR